MAGLLCGLAVAGLLVGWARHTLTHDDVSSLAEVLVLGICLACALDPEEE